MTMPYMPPAPADSGYESLAVLYGTEAERVGWGIKLPGFVPPEQILMCVDQMQVMARAFGSTMLRIASEDGQVAERHYGREELLDRNGRVRSRVSIDPRSPSFVRTVARHEGDATEGADWIILNRAQILDDIQERQHILRTHHFHRGGAKIVENMRHEDPWAAAIDTAVKSGLKELVLKTAAKHPLRGVRAFVATTDLPHPFAKAVPEPETIPAHHPSAAPSQPSPPWL